ncbi:protein of unknown function [Duganella sp. CF402]|uniref:DUF4153 domain-containing protein n=1 Tax=unclassified Duganella TaxID=2636909 RepID=UPI0008C28BAE|nr:MULTISPECIES: DUF4153 domain-containing protein [unclassified Duganella]RZT09567.1 uncharacterized protein DUF4153 [Duganella sp. BK701]SEL51992.1 protein of unknown function [Duganella sp. CF402]
MDQNEIALEAEVSRKVMAGRLAVGLVQGLLLYWLWSAARDGAWPATVPMVMGPLVALLLILPVLLISSLGHMAPRQAAAWLATALAVLLALSLHDAWRGMNAQPLLSNWDNRPNYAPSVLLVVFSVVFFFIAQALVLAGVQEKRRIAGYNAYFETAWKLAIQLLFSAFFVGALFFVLLLGSQLFMLVKLNFLRDLLRESWFNVPVICTAFSCAMHITDVRPSIVRGIRTLLLVLMSWILPVAVVLVTGFLCTLPFTGLAALWETRHATSVLLGAAAVLLVLINAAFQNGEALVALPLRVAARTAAILILPVTAVGIYALGLRVAQYGWTSDRVIAAACLLVALFYAIGYVWAAYQYDTWLKPVSTVNVWAAFLVLAVLLALFTPIADPAGIGVNSQMARLDKGKTAAADFDFRYLRFEGGRYGQEALEELKQRTTGPDAALLQREATAALAMALKDRWMLPKKFTAPASVAANLSVWPADAQLPASFLAQEWELTQDDEKPACLTRKEGKCDAILLDADGDDKQEVLLLEKDRALAGYLYAERSAGKWAVAATLSYLDTSCAPLMEKLRKGEFSLVAPRFKELEVGGRRVRLEDMRSPKAECSRAK